MAIIKAEPLVLVDGSSYLYRAFHAFPPLTNASGYPTGAMYGVLNMIKSLYQKVKPKHIVIVFDAKGKTFRDDLFAEYKANRPPMPDDLKLQVQPLYDMLQAQGFPLLVLENIEADDVIGTLAKQYASTEQQVLISTGDKDMAQLVDENIILINTMNNTILDHAGVIAKFGIAPEFIIDYLALMGDSSDNIPGVPGIGEKTARVLIQQLGGLQTIYANLDQVASLPIRGAKTLANKLINAKAQADLSYALATIKTDVDIPDNNLANFTLKPVDKEKLVSYYQEYAFKKWLVELKLDANHTEDTEEYTAQQNKQLQHVVLMQQPIQQTTTTITAKIDRSSYRMITTEPQLQDLIQELMNSEYFAIDTETDNLNYMQANLIGISIALANTQAYYIPLAHSYLGIQLQLGLNYVLAQLKPILASTTIGKIGQNIKYDLNVLHKYDIQINNIIGDSMLASYVLNSLGRHNMDDLAKRYLNYTTLSYTDVVGKGRNQIQFSAVDLQQATEYAAEDADVTMRLHQFLLAELEKQPALLKLYQQMELPLIEILSNMELNGVLVDKIKLNKLSAEFNQQILKLEEQVYLIAGTRFNLSSPKQLQEILFNKLQLPILKKTPTGVPSTNEEVLVELAEQFELPKLILQHRSLSKLKSTYTDKLPLLIDHKTNRIHTSYNQAITTTGRLSSSDPNLQNIPVRNAEGRLIRQTFIARPNYKIVAADYSQIELRIMAHLSNDQGMLTAFKNNMDIHRATAAEIFEIPADEVTNEQRRSAKAINFGLIYGMSAFGLAKQLNLSRSQAQAYIDRYFTRYPGVAIYMQDIQEVARQQGYVETIFKRRLYLPDILAKNNTIKKMAERLAINAPMQGSAADIIKQAMINIYQQIKDDTNIYLLMQVHDELVFEVAETELARYQQIIKQCMQQVVQLKVPLIVDIGIGNNWDEAH